VGGEGWRQERAGGRIAARSEGSCPLLERNP